MKMNLFYFLIVHLIVLIPLVTCSTSCSIFVSLNCSCYQSNFDLNSSLPRKSFSHLYCQGNSLNKKTFLSPFGSDFPYHNRFRTVSIEFHIEKQIEIHSNQFGSLSLLFSETNKDAQIEISIRFSAFNRIKFNKQSITSKMFQQKHQNKRLALNFIPATINTTQIDSGEGNFTDVEKQFSFSENCFSGLTLSQFKIYIHSLRDRFPASYSFEHIFNNTNIGELHLYGSIILPGPPSLRRTFKGLVRSLTLHRRVDTIDSDTFPYYFTVYSYTIHSIEAHSMDLNSFIPLYNNLRGLELLKPRFEVSIDKFIPTLDSLTLDIEYLNERTLLAGKHIYNLKLGSRLRRINPQVLYSLLNNLKNFDLFEIDLSQMISESRCYLIHFLINNSQRQLNIIFPRIENLTECDCAGLIINDIQSIKNFKDNQESLCSKKCRFSDCPTISEYFRLKYPLFTNDIPLKTVSNQVNNDLPSVDLFSDTMDDDILKYLLNQTKDQETSAKQRRPTTTPFVYNEEESVNDLLTTRKTSYIINVNVDEEKFNLSESKTNNLFSWISFLIGALVILLFVVISVSIVFLIVRCRKEKQFIRVPVAYV